MVDVAREERSPLKGAIIGFGNVAAHGHVPAWLGSDRFTIEAVVEPHPERAEMARKLLPEARIYSEAAPLFAGNGLDFVDICTPPCFHVDLTLAACQAGLHVFCEKPLAPSVSSISMMHEAARRKGRVIFTVNNWKYAPLWRKTFELVREGRLGTLRRVCLNVLRTPNSGGGASDWRKLKEIAWGGILIDHGWHNLYVVLALLRELPLSISARMQSSPEHKGTLEETVDLSMQFREAEARIYLTWQASSRRNFGIIAGDNGTLAINDDHLILESRGGSPIRYDFPEPLSAGSHHPEWMAQVIENFDGEIQGVNGGSNFLEAQWCTQLIDLAYLSQCEGSRPVEVCSSASGLLSSCA